MLYLKNYITRKEYDCRSFNIHNGITLFETLYIGSSNSICIEHNIPSGAYTNKYICYTFKKLDIPGTYINLTHHYYTMSIAMDYVINRKWLVDSKIISWIGREQIIIRLHSKSINQTHESSYWWYTSNKLNKIIIEME